MQIVTSVSDRQNYENYIKMPSREKPKITPDEDISLEAIEEDVRKITAALNKDRANRLANSDYETGNIHAPDTEDELTRPVVGDYEEELKN